MKSLAAALDAGTPQIGALVRQYGVIPIEGYVRGCIVALRDFINIPGSHGSMTDEQTIATAEMVVSDFPNISLADIALIFRRARKGDYGKIYGRMDGQIILGWFSEYEVERALACEQRSISEAGAAKSGYTRQMGNKAAWKFAEELSTLNRKKQSSPCPASTDGGKN